MSAAQLTNELLLAQLILLSLIGVAQFIALIVLVWTVTGSCSGVVNTDTFTLTVLNEPDGTCASSRADQ